MLKYRWDETPKITKLLAELDALRFVFEKFPSLPNIEESLRRESLLKSSVYSARIEGNPLGLSTVRPRLGTFTGENVHKREVFNLVRAYELIRSGRIPKKLSLAFIRKLHGFVMREISPSAGRLRIEPWGIFNQSGVAVYLAPAHFNVPPLMEGLIRLANAQRAHSGIQAGLIQFLFEKIHPFADGNGRVGRLISSFILEKGGYGFRGLISFEEYIDSHREEYYEALEPSVNATIFIEFFLCALVSQANITLERLREAPKKEASEEGLLPRRREILATLKDHPDCSFDFISRRFASVNRKTLHFDLSRLMGGGFIQKVGSTRGALYRAK